MNHVSIRIHCQYVLALGMSWKFIYIYFDLDFEKNKGDHHVTRWLRQLESSLEEKGARDAVTFRILAESRVVMEILFF